MVVSTPARRCDAMCGVVCGVVWCGRAAPFLLHCSVPKAFDARRSVSTYLGDLMSGAMLFNKRFTAQWAADGYRFVCAACCLACCLRAFMPPRRVRTVYVCVFWTLRVLVCF